jgi:HEAT repeat protein
MVRNQSEPFSIMPMPVRSVLLPLLAVIGGLALTAGCGPATKPAPKPAAPAAEPVPEPAVETAAEPASEPAAEPAPPQPAEPARPAAAPAVQASGLAELIETLTTTDDSRIRVITIDAIATRRRGGLEALDPLVKALADEEPRVRWHAARGIGLLGRGAVSAIPALVELLADEDPITVTQAAAAIGHIRGDDSQAEIPAAEAAIYAASVEPLVGTLVHPDPRVRRAAVRTLRQVSTSKQALLAMVRRQLGDADPAAVMPVLHTLADMGEDAVPFLIEALEDPKSRFWAEVVLAEIGPAAAAAAEPLAKLAGSGEIEDRLQSIMALARIGAPATVAGPELIAALGSSDRSLQYAAAYALGQIQVAAADEPLAKAAGSDDPFLVTLASWARAKINPDDAELRGRAVERLLGGLGGESPAVRRAAVEGLSGLAEDLSEPERGALAGTLVGLLGDPVPEVVVAAGGALIRLGGDATAALQEALARPAVRPIAMELLAELGPAAAPALGEMVAGLADPDGDYRTESAMAIAAVGPGALEAIGPLEKLLGDDAVEPQNRYAAAYALGRIGPAALAAEPLLRQLTNSDDELMATVAVWAALKIKPDDKTLFDAAIPKLRRALLLERELTRLEAAVALGEIGSPAASALPMLELLAEEDPSQTVRAAAAAAARQIRAPE